MCKKTIIVVSLLISIFTSCDQSSNKSEYSKSSDAFRLLSYNIRHCGGNNKAAGVDVARTAKLISDLQPDVVCLQEVDNKIERTNKVDQTKELMKMTNMKGYFNKSIDLGSGEYGNALLYRGDAKSFNNVPLPGKEPRSVAFIEFENYVVASIHLALQDSNRIASVEIINDAAKKYGKLVYLAGDFNESNLKGEFFTKLLKDWTISTSENLVENDNPDGLIDFILTLKGYEVEIEKSRQVKQLEGNDVPKVSDHLPVYCDFVKK